MNSPLDRLRTLSTPAVAALFVTLYAALAIPFVQTQPVAIGAAVVASVVLASALAVLSAIDVATMRLPNVWTLPLVVAGLAFAAWSDPALLSWRVISAVAGFVIFWLTAEAYHWARGRMGLGMGDAKLLAASGAWLGLENLASVVLIAAILGLLFALAAKLLGREMTLGSRIPFGPFLALGTWWTWLYGSLA
jgi:leader peptidase (prepilin peptidase) / N-methyltransferase